MVCFRHIIVNTPHKGDNNDSDYDDDDDDNNNNNSIYSLAGITVQTQLKNHDEYLDSQIHQYDTITHTHTQKKDKIEQE